MRLDCREWMVLGGERMRRHIRTDETNEKFSVCVCTPVCAGL